MITAMDPKTALLQLLSPLLRRWLLSDRGDAPRQALPPMPAWGPPSAPAGPPSGVLRHQPLTAA